MFLPDDVISVIIETMDSFITSFQPLISASTSFQPSLSEFQGIGLIVSEFPLFSQSGPLSCGGTYMPWNGLEEASRWETRRQKWSVWLISPWNREGGLHHFAGAQEMGLKWWQMIRNMSEIKPATSQLSGRQNHPQTHKVLTSWY